MTFFSPIDITPKIQLVCWKSVVICQLGIDALSLVENIFFIKNIYPCLFTCKKKKYIYFFFQYAESAFKQWYVWCQAAFWHRWIMAAIFSKIAPIDVVQVLMCLCEVQ